MVRVLVRILYICLGESLEFEPLPPEWVARGICTNYRHLYCLNTGLISGVGIGAVEFLTMALQEYHFWVGNKTGYTWGLTPEYKARPQPGERLKYLGFTTDTYWPKKLNTGRLLQKPNYKSQKRQKKYKSLI